MKKTLFLLALLLLLCCACAALALVPSPDHVHFAWCTDTDTCAVCGLTTANGIEIAYVDHPWPDNPVYGSNANSHWIICPDCGETFYSGEHWAWCDDPDTCAECGMTVAQGAVMEYVSHRLERLHDETYHWSVCNNCHEVLEKQEHEAFCTNPNVCLYCYATTAEGAVISEIVHSDWEDDYEYRSDAQYHWTVCTDCGEVLRGLEGHYAVCTDPDVCVVCGATTADGAVIDAVLHTGEEEYRWDDYSHWKACPGCGIRLGWLEEHYANCANPDVCAECGAKTSDGAMIAHIEHPWPDNPVYGSNANWHWPICPDCGEKMYDGEHYALCTDPNTCVQCGMTTAQGAVISYVDHPWPDNPVFCTTATSCWLVCSECGEKFSENEHFALCHEPDACIFCGMTAAQGAVITVEHKPGWRSDDTYHWDACITCGEALSEPEVHYAVCTDMDTCAGCGRTTAQGAVMDHIEHPADPVYKWDEGYHRLVCPDCNSSITGVADWHYAVCTDPDTCVVCGATTADGAVMELVEHIDGDAVYLWDEYSHWDACPGCGERFGYEDVHYAVCTDPDTCEVCGATTADGISIYDMSHNDNEKFSYTAGEHRCYCPDCGKTIFVSGHRASCDQPEVCAVCGAKASDGAVINDIDHNIDYDQYEYTAEEHFYRCSDCGETFDTGAHWARCDEPETCIYCGMTVAQGAVIKYIEHDYETETLVPYDETSHSRICNRCHQEMYKSEHWADSCMNQDQCSGCGAKVSEGAVIGNIWHNWDDQYGWNARYHWDICKDCGEVLSDGSPHWARCGNPNVCEICGAKTADGAVINDISHDLDWENMERTATEHIRSCRTCGNKIAEKHWAWCIDDRCNECGMTLAQGAVIEIIEHETAGQPYEYDDTYHWRICLMCNQPVKQEKHKALCTNPTVCVLCEAKASEGTAFQLIHDNTNLTFLDAVAPTCTEPGRTEGVKCGACGKIASGYEVVPALGHDWDDGKVTTEATCEAAGVRTFTCKNDPSHTQWAAIPALGHTEEALQAVAATCEEAGLTAGVKCSVCEKVLTAQQVVPALGHDWNEGEVTTKATCEAAGVKTFTCKNDATHTKTEAIPALGHTEEAIKAVAATCEETGLTAGVKCSVCEKILTEQKVVPALGHDWDEGEVTTKATCEAAGVKTFTCKNDPTHTKTEAIPALGHTEEELKAVAATCEKTGLTAGVKCSVCGKVLTEQKVVPALGHDWNEGEVTTKATCEAAGVKTFTCKNDATHTKTEAIPALGHTEEELKAVAATCEETGLTAGVKCSVCGKVLTEQKVVPALGHDWDEGEVTTKATCEAAGVKTFTCKNDATHTKTEAIPALGHTEEEIKAVAATCEKTGLTAGVKCSVCEKVLTAQQVVPALGHDFVNGVCTVCGEADPNYVAPVENNEPAPVQDNNPAPDVKTPEQQKQEEEETAAEVTGNIANNEVLSQSEAMKESVVEVRTDDSGEKVVTVAITAKAQETGAPENVSMALEAGALTQLNTLNVDEIKVSGGGSGTVAVTLNVQELAALTENMAGANLVVDIAEKAEIKEETVAQINKTYDIVGEAVAVNMKLVAVDGAETGLAGASLVIQLEIEKIDEDTVILFVDKDGNIIVTEAVWVEATEDTPAHWEVPYLGEGSYIPVVKK